MQSYTEISESRGIRESRELLLNNDKTAMSCSSGNSFPTNNLEIGMFCFRTDNKCLYQLVASGTWRLALDLSGSDALVAKATSAASATSATSATTATTATTALSAKYSDLAEFFPRGEETEVGDIIALDISADDERYIKATEDSICVVGVHSEGFGHCMGGEEPKDTLTREAYLKHNLPKYIPVGLIGRVPVKMKGIVYKGAKVVPSNIPGVGKVFDPEKDNASNVIGYLVEDDTREDVRLLMMKLMK